ncbi:class I SAM-dependent methyltransferase [Nocardia australiensis]|uniref:class I SAM-dependent methyltransferase n=1 Tax=Nocardia australiensis TaxID=2887191 RepID=UPI001D13EBC5|nr:class I SAM-dependent methyltransferase [Nocardia australiensis]
MGNSTDESTDQRNLHARRAASFGGHAAEYADHRPDYPAAAIQWALEPLGQQRSLVVLDLGAGTGKLTEGLLAAGAEPVAVEPDAEMRGELIARYPSVTTIAGTAESIPLPDASVDAVVAGQAFHWFDPERAFPEIARVLRDDGVFAGFWNTNDKSVEWVAGLNEVARFRAVVPPQASEADRFPKHPLFPEFDIARFAHSQRRTAESLTATIGTHSHTLVIPEQERVALLGRILDYLHSRPETAEGEFDLPMVTLTVRAVCHR